MATDPSSWAARTSKAVLLIRILVGWVFVSEGIQKFLFPDTLGVGRFVKIGIPWPHEMAPFVGTVEILCGTLVLVGLLTRIARDSLAWCDLRRFVLHEDRHVCEIRILGHAARSADRCEHDARTDLSCACGWRSWSVDALLAGRRRQQG
jgi:putative oxidoreductase